MTPAPITRHLGKWLSRSLVSRRTGHSWGFVTADTGELQWQHGPGKPGGRAFCYFDGDDAVSVWTHERLGQPSHRDVLVTARKGGSDHVNLTRWWRPIHHLIDKAVQGRHLAGAGQA